MEPFEFNYCRYFSGQFLALSLRHFNLICVRAWANALTHARACLNAFCGIRVSYCAICAPVHLKLYAKLYGLIVRPHGYCTSRIQGLISSTWLYTRSLPFVHQMHIWYWSSVFIELADETKSVYFHLSWKASPPPLLQPFNTIAYTIISQEHQSTV